MRVGLVVAIASLFLAFAPAARAGVFPDLPGSDMLEESIADKAPGDATRSGNTPADAPDTPDRVPAPDPVNTAKAGVTADQIEVVTALPGGGGLPIIKDVARTSGRASGQPAEDIAPLVLFAALFTLAFARFLFRLNELGRRP